MRTKATLACSSSDVRCESGTAPRHLATIRPVGNPTTHSLAEREDAQLASTSTLALFGREFVIRSEQHDLIDEIERQFVDLRVVADNASTLEYRLTQVGPDWLHHAWSLSRDGELLSDAVDRAFLATYIVGDVTTVVTESTPGLIGLRGSTLTLVDRTVLLVNAVGQWSAATPSWWNEMAFIASMMTDGWSLVASGSSLFAIDESDLGPVHQCWRPLYLREDPSGESPSSGAIIPASEFGPLASTAVLDAVVILRVQPDADSSVETLTPAETLYELASALISTEGARRQDFVRLVSMVERLPAFALHAGTDDLTKASQTIATTVRSIT